MGREIGVLEERGEIGIVLRVEEDEAAISECAHQ
jgi:hypothetical protein